MFRNLSLVVALAGFAAVTFAAEPPAVEKAGFESKLIREDVVRGHLTELNGKYKLRLSRTTYTSGGHIGSHHHVGPGIRYVESGELTYIEAGHDTVYKAGDTFYETGAVTHQAMNRGKTPVVLLNFELLPADWKGSSAIAPPKP